MHAANTRASRASAGVEVALEAAAELAESPWWDTERAELLWVDIPKGEIHHFDPASGTDHSITVGQPVGTVVGRRSGGVVCAVRDGIGYADLETGAFELVAPVEADRASNRMNDGACDANGRLWVGTMNADLVPGAGSLYRVSADLAADRMISPVSISNGLDWSPDGRTFYYVDSLTRQIDAYDFEPGTGTLRRRRTLVKTPGLVATPDGMAVDAEGCLWVAMWEGGSVLRYSPAGELLTVVDLPVTRVTSVAFGGARLDQLFITSARAGLTSEQLMHDEPLAGAIFAVDPHVTGLAPHRFAG
ncbi:SMP-30/gluconolactonase/LRE family protein [Cryobacterium roopkundense]|uniref:Sugar lactone lactonase YvrE n=1 Tax=Cryobacterium roopkundense TaxID=1001240 RepID=A0A7W8ZUJ7_9MICO|nr:sugar lactone lactonase YvrE [Cryobacterium roopkundense]